MSQQTSADAAGVNRRDPEGQPADRQASWFFRQDFSDLALADLARAGFELTRRPGAEVNFIVQHAPDSDGLLLRTLEQYSRPSDSPRFDDAFSETVTSALNGLSLIAVVAQTERPSHPGVGNDRSGRTWLRRTNPNPTFLYDRAQVFEGLFVIAVDRDQPTLQDSMIVRELVLRIADLAVYYKAPILSLAFPEPVPPNATESPAPKRNGWPRARGLGVRFSIALRSPTMEVRSSIVQRLLGFSSKVGLAVRSPHPGARAGNWISVREVDIAQNHEGSDAKWPDVVVPATFVGPAKVGSTHAIVSYLDQWGDAVGINGCSVVSLDDLAFIHLQLRVRGEASTRAYWSGRLGHVCDSNSQSSRMGLTDRLGEVLEEICGFRPDVDLPEEVYSRAKEYHSFLGPPSRMSRASSATRVLMNRASARVKAASGEERSAIWVSWLAGRTLSALTEPLSKLESAFTAALGDRDERVCPVYGIESLVCQEVSDGRLRATGRLSVADPVLDSFRRRFGESEEAFPAKVCRVVEDEWRGLLDGKFPVIELTVSWRELWLGHWSAMG